MAVARDSLRPPRRLLGASVTAAIRELILQQQVRPGDRLGLVELAERMETSITPVREALFQLSQDGWVTHEPHRGFRVAPLHRDDVLDTYRVWANTEGDIAAHAAVRLTEAGIVAVRAADLRLRELEDHSGPVALELNDDLHRSVHDLSRAPKLVWFTQVARRSVPLQFDQTFAIVPGWGDLNRHGHTAIVDAIAAGDPDESRRLMAEHFFTTGELLVQHIDALGLWSDDEDADAAAVEDT